MQKSIVRFYCFVVQPLLNMFRALLCPSSGARQTAVAASGFRMNVEVEVFSYSPQTDHGPKHVEQCLYDKAIKFYDWLLHLVGYFIWVIEDARNHKP
jgi:hypothetical protein